jgi:putative phosphoesterase
MKIAVVSDVHDHIRNLQEAVKKIKKAKCGAIILCGDLGSPFTAEILGAAKIPIYAAWGNADHDYWALAKKAGENLISTPPEQDFGEVVLGGKKIAYCHFPGLARKLSETKYYDAVFHGHTHRTYIKKAGDCILANPGAISGVVGGKRGLASYMVFDTKEGFLETVKIE